MSTRAYNINMFEVNWNNLGTVANAQVSIDFVAKKPKNDDKMFYDFDYTIGGKEYQGHVTLVADNLDRPHVTLLHGYKGKKTNYHFLVGNNNVVDPKAGYPKKAKGDSHQELINLEPKELYTLLLPQLNLAFAGYI